MKPSQSLRHAIDLWPVGHKGAVDQDDGQGQGASSVKLGSRSGAASVFGDDMGDAVGLQQIKVALQRKRAARDKGRGLRQGQGGGMIDQPQKVMMLGLCGEIFQVLPPDGQKHPCGGVGQGCDSAGHIGHMVPKVALHGLPRGAFKGYKRGFGQDCGLHRVVAHLGCEGVGCVDQVGNGILAQVIHQPHHPAKAADALRQGLTEGRLGAACVGKDRVNPLICQGFRQTRRLGCAAKQKDAGHG